MQNIRYTPWQYHVKAIVQANLLHVNCSHAETYMLRMTPTIRSHSSAQEYICCMPTSVAGVTEARKDPINCRILQLYARCLTQTCNINVFVSQKKLGLPTFGLKWVTIVSYYVKRLFLTYSSVIHVVNHSRRTPIMTYNRARCSPGRLQHALAYQ